MSEFDKEVERIDVGGDAWDENDEEIVDFEVKRPMDKIVSVRLVDSEWRLLLAQARALGVGPNALAQKWVLERLASKTKAKSA
jgi:hypothetical protein